MTIELPLDIYFTDQDDIVPMSGAWTEAILNNGATYTLAGDDHLTGASFFNNNGSTIDTGKGRDVITGRGIDNRGSIETGDDDDYLGSYTPFYNFGTVSLGDGNDGLRAEVTLELANNYSALSNYGTIEAGNGDDSLYVIGSFYNSGMMSLGDGNDSITINAHSTYTPLQNYQTIETGDGDDIILSTGAIYNHGVINTGSGNDSLTAYGGFYDSTYHGGYDSGNVFLGNGNDYLKGFGNGYFVGGNDQDSLELPSGNYRIQISGAVVSFIGYSQTMQTFGFEKLIAGSTTYDFTSFSDELNIFVP
jgi:hypothetical protein